MVMALLAGGPSIAVVCDALCSDRPHEAAANEATAGVSRHHAPAVQPEEPAGLVVAASDGRVGHDHHQATVLETQTFPESDTRLIGSFGRECCSDLDHPRVSRTAVRADTSLISTPEAAVRLPVAVLDRFDRHARGTMHTPPPWPLALGRTTLVLRI